MNTDTFLINGTSFELPSADEVLNQSGPMAISSTLHDYDVEFIAEADTKPQTSTQTLVVADRRVLELHPDAFNANIPVLGLDAVEDTKTFDGVSKVVDYFTENRASRDSQVTVAGGGIIQDTVGFACAIYKRGLPWTYHPTTLLAQGDSCIGAKTGINYGRTKNILGLFAAPNRVVVQSRFLKTLDRADVLSGLSEIFKLCIIAGEGYLGAFEKLLEPATQCDPTTLVQLSRLSLMVKKPVIELDEFEADTRKALNFGHSVGHALEVVTEHGIPHGLAVCFGLLVESAVSNALGLLSTTDLERLLQTGSALLPETTIASLQSLPYDDLIDIMARDKKATVNGLTLPVPVTLGEFQYLNYKLDDSAKTSLRGAVATVLAGL